LGMNTKTRVVYALWYSDSGKKGTDGVNAQPMWPTKGSRVHAPGSSNGGSVGPQQNLSGVSTARGVFTAYVPPSNNAIDIWKVGAPKIDMTVPAHTGIGNLTLTAGPSGRLWLLWRSGDQKYHAMRSNKADTRFGPATTVAGVGTDDGRAIGTVGSSGPLEVVALVVNGSNHSVIVERQIRPKLSVKVSPASVHRGHKFTVTATDAGDPVAKATVSIKGKSEHTNGHGKARFTATSKDPLGKDAISVKLSGYPTLTAHITVKK
jgi:hypothetical protein